MTLVVEEDRAAAPAPPAAAGVSSESSLTSSADAVEEEAVREAEGVEGQGERQERRIDVSEAKEAVGKESGAEATAAVDGAEKKEGESVEGRFFIKQKLCFLGLGDVSSK